MLIPAYAKHPWFALILLTILSATTGQHVYWIAPNATQCGERTPCYTLDYYYYNSSLFSTSHTKWIFLPGVHRIRSPIIIENAVNVTLTGEHPCTNSSEPSQCSTLGNVLNCDEEEIPKHTSGSMYDCCGLSGYMNDFNPMFKMPYPNAGGYFGASNFNTLAPRKSDSNDLYLFMVKKCSGVVVRDLNIQNIMQEKDYTASCRANSRSLVFNFEQVSNVALYSVTSKRFTPVATFTSVVFAEPSGTIIVNNSHLESLRILEPNHYRLVITQSRFTGEGISLKNVLREQHPFSSVKFDNCQFVGATVEVDFFYYSSVIIDKCVFENSKCILNIKPRVDNTTSASLIKVSDTLFIYGQSELVMLKDINSFTKVTFSNVTFENNSALPKKSGKCIMTAEHDLQNGPGPVVFTQTITPAITFENCTFQQNRFYTHQICLYHLSQMNPFQFKGHSMIHENNGGGIYLYNSVLWVQGCLDIKNNGNSMSLKDSGLNISDIDRSQIWLGNNSEMNISSNKGFGVFVPCKEGHVRSNSCLIRLVHDREMPFELLVAEDDLENFNASLVVSGNYFHFGDIMFGEYHGNQIYNAHLQNCVRRLKKGNETLSLEEDKIKKYLILDSWDETVIGSPPYNVCLCDVTQPNIRDHWICNSPIFNRTVYPGLSVTLAAVALGDLDLVQPANFTITTGDETRNYNKSISGCTELHTFTPKLKPSTYRFILVARSLYDEMSVRTAVNIVVTSQCPPGMSISHSSKTDECRCNHILISHGFHCDIKPHEYHDFDNVVTYRSATSHQWLGYWNGLLVLSNYCPSHYCSSDNSSLLTTGVTLEGLNTSVQCDPNSKRQGLLCSQCTTGTSSQFGSFRCAKCTFAGLLLVPFGVVIGILLVVFLFLFNFTVLQGDVVGIAFYANIVCIMDEFLLKYAPRPFYGTLALINVGFGFEVCFFDGMDEFAKAIIQFLFPFYLFSLVIIIIIAAHKFNLKIFRVRFVGRRSVPVLATIMLITYSGLINAVIYGLQYTTIYDVESGTQQLVWLHQPELEYFRGKHIAVGILCLLVLLFYLLPLTIVTLFGDLFRMCSRNLWYSHFLDVFHGAFRYPFGFWFGTRLLFRIVFITLNITTNTPVVAYTIFLTTGAIILLQFLLEPFRTDNVTIYRPDPERKVTRRDLMKEKISKIFRPKIIDSLFLFNVMFMTAAVLGSTDISSMYTTVGVCLSISLALVQLVAVVVHHTYHYFPLPNSTPQRMEAFRERYFDFRERMREKLRARRDRTDTPDIAPVQITYLSASMCFNSEEYTSSSSSSEEGKSESEYHEEDETRENTATMV